MCNIANIAEKSLRSFGFGFSYGRMHLPFLKGVGKSK